MKAVAVTQRVWADPAHGERRDCLDQAWTKFLASCGLLPVLLPNVIEATRSVCKASDIAGFLFTGGNDLTELGGDAPERDAVESFLLDVAERRGLPVLGVCRGMQVIQRRFGVQLQRVERHVAPRQLIQIEGKPREVNSYHHFGALNSQPPLDVWATASDGVIKAIRHSSQPILGIMWHPERIHPFSPADIELFRKAFKVE